MKSLPIPDTALANAVAALAAAAAPRFLLNHSYRTFCFGSLLIGTVDVDAEAAFIASMFHDLGLTEHFSGDRSFELVGAAHAARFLEDRGWPVERIALVEQAIIRHTELDPLEDPVLRIVQAGAALDVAGVPESATNMDSVIATIQRYPREGFVAGITSAFLAEIDAQPDGVFAKLEATISLSSLMSANPMCAHDTPHDFPEPEHPGQ